MSDSTRGIVFGVILLAVVFPVIGWQESRAVSTARAIEQGSKLAVSASAEKIDPANDQRLVCLTGDAKSDEELTDPVFGVRQNALKMQRTVETYQWVEHQHTEARPGADGQSKSVVTSYSKQWSPLPIDSRKFVERGYENPTEKPWPDWQGIVSAAHVGVFPLPRTLLEQFSAFAPLPITDADHERLPAALRDKLKLVNGEWTTSTDPGTPIIGDARIRFVAARPGPVTILARQDKESLAPYYPDYPTPRPIEALRAGRMTADEIIKDYAPAGSTSAWWIRGVSFLLLWGGLALIGGIVTRFVRAVPYVGLVAAGGERLFVFGLGVVVWLITVGSYWFSEYPMFAIVMYLISLVTLVVLFRRGQAAHARSRKNR